MLLCLRSSWNVKINKSTLISNGYSLHRCFHVTTTISSLNSNNKGQPKVISSYTKAIESIRITNPKSIEIAHNIFKELTTKLTATTSTTITSTNKSIDSQSVYDISHNSKVDHHALELLSVKAIQMNNHILLDDIINYYLTNNYIIQACQLVELIHDHNMEEHRTLSNLRTSSPSSPLLTSQPSLSSPSSSSSTATTIIENTSSVTTVKDDNKKTMMMKIMISDKICLRLINQLVDNYNWHNSCIVAMYMIQCGYNIPNNAIFFTIGGLMTKTAGEYMQNYH